MSQKNNSDSTKNYATLHNTVDWASAVLHVSSWLMEKYCYGVSDQ